jgi:hypothetical protein
VADACGDALVVDRPLILSYWPTRNVDSSRKRSTNAEVTPLFEYGELTREPGRKGHIVGVLKSDVVATALGEQLIAGAAVANVAGVMEPSNTRVGVLIHQDARSIRGAIIGDQELPIAMRLHKDAPDRFFNKTGSIECWPDD